MRTHRMLLFWIAGAIAGGSAQAQTLEDNNNAVLSLPSGHAPIAALPPSTPTPPQVAVTAPLPADLDIVRAILAQPGDQIDLAQVEMAVERIIDPNVSEMATLHQLDVLAANARARFPQGDATDPELKGMTLLSTMRDAGPWNDNRPFRYDLENPLGKNVNDKLISHLLDTRLGNCVSMPVLFVIVGQKLGLPVTLSTAPMHVFAKFRKDDGTWTNLEITNYGGQTDAHYQERMGISPSAMAQHTYLRTLTRKQSAQVILETLVEHYYFQTKQYEQVLALTDLLLQANPNDVPILLFRGDAFARLSDQRYKRYGPSSNIPAKKRGDYLALEQNNRAMFSRADALGWAAETPEHEAAYLKWIQQAKAQGLAR